MQLTVLGCYGPYPAPDAACSGYLVQQGQTNLLLDCGCGVLPRLMALMNPEMLDALVLTHLHADHMSDVLTLRYYLEALVRRRATPNMPLRIYAPAAPTAISVLFTDALMFRHHPIVPGEPVAVGDCTLTFFAGRHPVPSYSVRVEGGGRALVYTGDTNEIEGLADFARDADLLLADANLLECDWHPDAPHLSARRAGLLAQQADARQLVLTHLLPGIAPVVVCAEASQHVENACCAAMGKVFTI